MHGPIAGKLMAEYILDGKFSTVDVSMLDLARFEAVQQLAAQRPRVGVGPRGLVEVLAVHSARPPDEIDDVAGAALDLGAARRHRRAGRSTRRR